MAKLTLPEEIVEKLERAAALRWPFGAEAPHKSNEIADERAALTAELTAMFGPIVEQIVAADILSIDLADGVSINCVHVDEEFGIILECEPFDMTINAN
jgi:hypothetical protein